MMLKKIVFGGLGGLVVGLIAVKYIRVIENEEKEEIKTQKEIINFDKQDYINQEILEKKDQELEEYRNERYDKREQTYQEKKDIKNPFDEKHRCQVSRMFKLIDANIKTMGEEEKIQINKEYYPKNLSYFLQTYCIGGRLEKLKFEYGDEYDWKIYYKRDEPIIEGTDEKLLEKIDNIFHK